MDSQFAKLDLLNEELKIIINGGILDVKETVENQVRDYLFKIDNKTKDILVILKEAIAEIENLKSQKDKINSDIQRLTNLKDELLQRKSDLESQAKSINQREVTLEKENQLVKEKQSQLIEREREIEKQRMFWEERLKNYKVAKPQ